MKFDSVCHTYSQLLGIDTVHVRVLLCYAISNNLSYLEMLLKKKQHVYVVLKRKSNFTQRKKLINAGKPKVPEGGPKVSRAGQVMLKLSEGGVSHQAPPSLCSSLYQYSENPPVYSCFPFSATNKLHNPKKLWAFF